MGTSKRGKASLLFEDPPLILSAASVVGKKEGEGPLGKYFDRIEMDSMLGKRTWEEAESNLQKDAVYMVMEKAGWKAEDVSYLFAGDLLGQCIATSFGISAYNIPLFGVYGACSTCGEALTLGAVMAAGGSFAIEQTLYYIAKPIAFISVYFAHYALKDENSRISYKTHAVIGILSMRPPPCICQTPDGTDAAEGKASYGAAIAEKGADT